VRNERNEGERDAKVLADNARVTAGSGGEGGGVAADFVRAEDESGSNAADEGAARQVARLARSPCDNILCNTIAPLRACGRFAAVIEANPSTFY